MSEKSAQLLYSTHALQRMFSRSITQDEVENCLIDGITIAEYPDDTPYPSKLLSFTSSIRKIHIVTAYNPEETNTSLLQHIYPIQIFGMKILQVGERNEMCHL